MIDELTKKLVEDARDILEGKNPKEEETKPVGFKEQFDKLLGAEGKNN